MTRMPDFALDFYDVHVTNLIVEKYGLSPFAAAHAFLTSRTHAMLEDLSLSLWDFGAPGIFDLWEAERVTGDPRNSVYIRGE